MNIALETIDTWELSEKGSVVDFFRGLPSIVMDGDIIAIGAYRPNRDILKWLKDNELSGIRNGVFPVPFSSECFEVNRREYPDGAAFMFHPTPSILSELMILAAKKGGGGGRNLFFEHIVGYRSGVPCIPLFDYHDAFSGGVLRLSGLYEESVVRRFASFMDAEVIRKRNAEGY